MNFKPLMLLALLLASTESQALPTEIFENMDGNTIVAFVEQAEIDAAPNWNPMEESPPLTIKGLTRTLHEFTTPMRGLSDARLREIELRQIPGHADYWHYLVDMTTASDGNLHHHYFMVLMNGKIIPAIREPESIK